VVATGEALVEDVAPELTGLIDIANTWLAEIVKAQTLGVAAASTQNTGVTKAAIVVNTLTPQVLAWAADNKYPVPDAATILKASNGLYDFLNAFETVTVSTPVVNPPAPVTGVPVQVVAQAAQTGSVVGK
jgi:hypothetical protein